MAQTHAQLLARALHARGARFAFGMPGGDVLPLLDAFAEVGIQFVLLRHEGSAGFAAAAVYELTRSPGVAVSTLGPGATNLVSGAAGALLDRARIVCITGQASAHIRDRYTHQVLDQVALMKPVTLRSTDVDLQAGGMQILASLRALDTSRPGPIHLDLSSTTASTPSSVGFEDWQLQPKARPGGVPDVSEAATLLRAAKRPVVVVGCGDLCFAAANGVRRLVTALEAPALCTYKALGMADPDHPLYAGPMGLSPVVDRHQQALLQQADLMVAVGLDPVELRPDWLPGWPEDLPLVAVDPHGQPDLLGAVVHDLVGPTRDTLDALREAAFGDEGTSAASTWNEAALADHRSAWWAPFEDGPTGPASAVRAIQRAAPANTRLCMDVGAHRITASHAWICREPLQNLQSNGLCSMATGLPFGLASKLVDPNRPCVVLSGDMGLLMCVGELGAVVEHNLDLVVVVFLDASLSLIELKQERKQLRGGGVRFANPDFVGLARSFGGEGVEVEGEDAVEAAVADALAKGGLQVIGVRIDAQAYRQQM